MRLASPHRFTVHRAGAISFALLGVVACGGDDEAAPAPPRDPPVLRIVALQPAGGSLWLPGPGEPQDCVERGKDPAGTIDVILSETGRIDNFTLRPLYGCDGDPQCGFVLLTIDPNQDGGPSHQVGAAATVLSVPFGKLGIQSGDHRLQVELRNDLGSPVVTGDAGKPVSAELNVTLCDDPFVPGVRDAGSDVRGSEGGTPADSSTLDASSSEASLDAGASADATQSDTGSTRDATSDTNAGATPGDASLATDAPTDG
jgi:hypothetical protein